jgi:hypothetical protein
MENQMNCVRKNTKRIFILLSAENLRADIPGNAFLMKQFSAAASAVFAKEMLNPEIASENLLRAQMVANQ